MEKLAKTDLILFSVILPLSILMRVPGLLYPLEFSGDEMGYLAKALKFGTGDLNPHYFVHPALSFYITFVAEAVFFVFGYFLGFFHSVSEFSTLFFNNPAPFLFAGRLPSLLFGAGTIYLVYLMGKNFFSKEVAICTALMLAITPLHIFESQTIRIRSIATFFGILCLYFIFTILKKGEKKDYVLAGLSLGLCLATEYTMIFFTLPLFTVIILNLQNKFFLKNGPTVSPKKGILFALSIALAILITCTPYTFFDYPANFKNITHFLNFGIDPTTVSNGNTVPEVSQGFHSEDINTNYVQAIVIVKQYISRVYYQIAHLFNLEYTIGKMFATVSIAGVLFAIYKREKEKERLTTLCSPLAGFL
ncbi:MAG: glycosyltransferase family 39 protein [Candidatus Brocadiaceae bacterium]|nr:glycosyltransferase family 39 protein [Candidatus Brocadiaceae bacterium]